MIVITIILVALFVPVLSFLTLNVDIPPTEDKVLLIDEKTSIANVFYRNYVQKPTNVTLGNIAVEISIIDSQNNPEWNGTYYVKRGNWVIKTFQTISKNERVIVKIPEHDFEKAILID